jgi:hypothetical protein
MSKTEEGMPRVISTNALTDGSRNVSSVLNPVRIKTFKKGTML